MPKSDKSPTLQISNLVVKVGDKEILHGINLQISGGQLHVVMGPNGSGKSTLTSALMGHPSYTITKGKVKISGKNILPLPPHERAKLGLLLGFQNPLAIPGVTVASFIRTAYRELHPHSKYTVIQLQRKLLQQVQAFGLGENLLKRGINDGFSGGERKKVEMLQLLLLQPKFVLLDEIDTGLDIDALKMVAKAVAQLQRNGCGVLLITHYQRIISYLSPDYVHILVNGRVVNQGGKELVKTIEEKGYAIYRN